MAIKRAAKTSPPAKRRRASPPPTPAKKVIELPTVAKRGASDIHQYITLFYGPPGVGKTTFVNDLAAQDVLFISTDRGARHLEAKVREVNNYQDILDLLEQLEAPNAPKYDMVCIDHVDDFTNYAEDQTIIELKIDSLSDAKWGQGWKEFKRRISHVVQRLKALNVGVVFISHEGIKTIRVHGIEREIVQPDMGKTAWKVIVPLVDLVGYCGFKAMQQGGKRVEKRVIYTEPSESVYAKDRTQRQKPSKGYELLDGAKFRSTFKTATATKKKIRSSSNGEEVKKQGRRARR